MTTDPVQAFRGTMTAVSRFEANVRATVVPLDQNPPAIYLAQLGSLNSRLLPFNVLPKVRASVHS